MLVNEHMEALCVAEWTYVVTVFLGEWIYGVNVCVVEWTY